MFVLLGDLVANFVCAACMCVRLAILYLLPVCAACMCATCSFTWLVCATCSFTWLVCAGVLLGILRILFEWKLLSVVIPGYSCTLVLTYFSSKEYVAIAWDSAGVST